MDSAFMHPSHPLNVYKTIATSSDSLMQLAHELQNISTRIKGGMYAKIVASEEKHLKATW